MPSFGQNLKLLIVGCASLLLTGCISQLSMIGPQKAGLQVITGEVPSTIFLNSQFGEKTPFINKELAPGEYVVRIEPDDPALVDYETRVTLTKGLLTVITWNPGTRPETSGGVIYEMEKLADKESTELSIVSIPERSIVSVDGKEKDFTPVIFDTLAPGEHEFEITLPSYDTQQHTINLVAGHRINVSVKLARAVTQPPEPVASSSATLTPSATASAQPTAPQTATPAASLNLTASGSGTTSSGQVGTVIAKPRVTIKNTNFFQAGKEVLRVRDQAGSGGKELGYAPVGAMYPYLGETTAQGWHKIKFNNQDGWVSSTYVVLEK